MDGATFESLPVAALLTRDGRIVAVNQAYCTMLGVPAEALVGHAVAEIIAQRIDPPDAPLVERAAETAGEGRGLEGSLWVRVLDGQGRPRSVRVVWKPSPQDPELRMVFLFDEGGAVEAKNAAEGFARAGGDLFRAQTEQEVLERAADALVEQGFTVTFLLIQGDDPFLAYGPTRGARALQGPSIESTRLPRGILTQFNPRFHEGRAAFLQMQETVDVAYGPDVARRVAEHRPGRFTLQAPLFVDDAPYGAFTLTGDHLTPALAGAAEVFAVLVARAIENVRHRATMLQHERLAAIGEAAAIMAHEVRNPIAAMLNVVTLLRRGEGQKDELLSMLSDEAQALEHIVSDLLTLGRPITPRLVVEDLRTPVARALSVTRLRELTAELRLAEGPAVPSAIDSDLVQIAVLNVLRNALQAAPEGSPIEVFVEARGDEAVLRIDDRGPGFPPEILGRVAEPFYTTRPAGTGIGLSAVRRIVEACGGRLEVGATDEGGGRVVMTFRGGQPSTSEAARRPDSAAPSM